MIRVIFVLLKKIGEPMRPMELVSSLTKARACLERGLVHNDGRCAGPRRQRGHHVEVDASNEDFGIANRGDGRVGDERARRRATVTTGSAHG